MFWVAMKSGGGGFFFGGFEPHLQHKQSHVILSFAIRAEKQPRARALAQGAIRLARHWERLKIVNNLPPQKYLESLEKDIL